MLKHHTAATSQLFISYCWKHRPEDVYQLVDYLRNEKNFRIWIDKEKMHGDIVDAMTQGIDGADVVLLFFSEEYKGSDNCQREAKYAHQQRKPIIPVKMHGEVVLSGWLGFIVGSSRWIPFYKGSNVAAVGDQITDEIEQFRANREKGLVMLDECPYFSNSYQRKITFMRDVFLKGLQTIGADSRGGLLILHGEEAIGKTYFVSDTLRDEANHHFVVHQCRIGSVAWLNCFRWKEESDFNTNSIAVFNSLLRQMLAKAASMSTSITLEDCVKGLVDKGRRPLIVFDDVYHFPLLKQIYDTSLEMHISSLAISRSSSIQIMQMQNPSSLFTDFGKNGIIEMEPLNETELIGMLKSTFGLVRLPEAKLRELAGSSGGSLRKLDDLVRKLGQKIKQKDEHPNECHPNNQKQVDLFVRACLSGSAHRDPNLHLPDLILKEVPQLDSHYFSRPEDEDAIRQGLRAIPVDGGFFCVDGGGGIGKSTLVAEILRDPHNKVFFQQQCRGFHAAIWLNCYQWRDGFNGNKMEEEKFESEILKLGNSLDNSKFLDIERMLHKFKERKQRILIVLDDVFDSSVLYLLRKKCQAISCCVITRNANDLQLHNFQPFFKSSTAVNPYTVGQLSEAHIVELFQTDYGMKDHLSEYQLLDMARRSCGLPLLVSMIGSKFKGIPSKHFRKTYEAAISDMSKWKIGVNARGEKTAKQFFGNILESFTEEQRQRYYAFLLFDPVEAIDLLDLQVLWHCEDLEEAREICEQFEKSATVRCVVEKDLTLGQRTKCFIHQILHEQATESASKRFGIVEKKAHMSRLRIQLIISFCQSNTVCDEFDDEKTIALFFNQLLLADKESLLKKILLKIKTTEFLDSSAKINCEMMASGHGTTSLMIAAATGHLKLVELFFNANPSAAEVEDENNETALMKACENAHWTVVRFLAEKSPDCVPRSNKIGVTPMMWAAGHGQLDIVKLLADIDTSSLLYLKADMDGETPVMAAARNGKLEVVKFLVDKHPNLATQGNKRGVTAIMWAAGHGHLDVVKYLAEKDLRCVAQSNSAGTTPIMWAAGNGYLEVVKYFAENYPQTLTQINKDGENVAKVATKFEEWHVLKFLTGK